MLILVLSIHFSRSAESNRTISIGAVPITSDTAFLSAWKPTFEDYLSDTVGQFFVPPARFEIVLLTLTSVFDAVKEKSIEFVFVNPSLFSCLESEFSGISSPGGVCDVGHASLIEVTMERKF